MKLFKAVIDAIKANQITQGKTFRSNIEKDMYINNTLGYRAVKDRVDYHDALYKRIGELKTKYVNDSNSAEYISELEKLIKDDPESENIIWSSLLDMYIKERDFNKAWGYTNKLLSKPNITKSDVYHAQVRILKKEKRDILALDALMAEYLTKYSQQNHFNRTAFTKDAGVCTRALKWDETMLNDIADMVEKQLKRKNYNEVTLHNSFKAYLQSKNILDKEF